MVSIPRKRAKVKKKASKSPVKKKKTAKKKAVSKKKRKKVVKTAANRLDRANKKKARRVAKLEANPIRRKPSVTTKPKRTKAVKKVSKKKHKKRAIKRKKKRGVLRDWIDKTLSTPMAQAQMLERLFEKVPGIFVKGWVETDESMIVQRLIRAEQLGAFENAARQAATDFDWSLRSVYELWHSPDVYFG